MVVDTAITNVLNGLGENVEVDFRWFLLLTWASPRMVVVKKRRSVTTFNCRDELVLEATSGHWACAQLSAEWEEGEME